MYALLLPLLYDSLVFFLKIRYVGFRKLKDTFCLQYDTLK